MKVLISKQFKAAGYAFTYSVVFAGILVAVNWLAIQHNETFDATERKLYSLSDQTHKILDGLERDVTISYFDRTSQFAAAQGLLRRYESASTRVSVEYVDLDEDPLKAEAMNVRSYGALVLTVDGLRHVASSISEQGITNTIITAIKGRDRTACVVSGHGESATDDAERNGFANAARRMQEANYEQRSVSLSEGAVPPDCTVLVVPGPDTAFFDPEIAALRDYVEGGGRALLMLAPVLPDGRGRRAEHSPKLVELLAGWGIEAGNDVVIDESAIGQLFGGGPFAPLVSEYRFHPIVEPLENVATLFPRARSVGRASEAPAGWSADVLFESSETSFATTELRADAQGFTVGAESSQRGGPIPLAVAAVFDVTEPEGEEVEPAASASDAIVPAADAVKPEGRVVAVGSAGFASNYGLALGGNLDLLLNMLNWLSSDEDLISVRPREPESTVIEMTAAEMNRIFYASLLLLPLIIIVTGVWAWWGRR